MKFSGTNDYISTKDLTIAVNAAITLERPLLVKGEPGTGKTELAKQVASSLGLEIFEWSIKSTTRAQQGLYEYDAVSRLRDSQIGDQNVSDISKYIKKGKIWNSFESNNKSVLLIEKNLQFGEGISSRNSEVIHAGIYYPENSLKAKFCRDGMERLYRYCYEKKISIKQTGKLIVQTSAKDEDKLLEIYNLGKQNGCKELRLLNSQEIKKFETEISAVNAIWSPKTGIFDSHSFMKSLLDDFEKAKGTVVFNHNLGKIVKKGRLFELPIDTTTLLKTKTLINCCGLHATKFLESIEDFPKSLIKKTSFCKGTYFGYQGKIPFNHHIYPIPNKAGLGIHFTQDLNENGQFGPDTEWINSEDYAVDFNRVKNAHIQIKKYWPNCDITKIRPVYSGIRPKIGSKVNFEKDFIIQTEHHHNFSGLINLIGIESPGLTASLSIANEIVRNYVED